MQKHDNSQSQICVRVWGGLANQMFQYAAGYASAQRLGCALLVDPAPSGTDHATYGLDLFALEAELWQPSGRHSPLTRLQLALKNEKKAQKNRYKLWPGKQYRQANFCFAGNDFQQIENGTYMQGYFQSERFFANCPDQIRQLFSLEHLQKSITPDLLTLAAHPQSVSVHIRRGDYASNPKVIKVHGLLSAHYYDPALALMRKINPDGPVLVFSDDMEAADDLTKAWPNRTLVRGQSRDQDLFLMSQCANHIIANSSFSWWGAWLGGNLNKTVIAPRRWFTRETMLNTYIDDLYPQGWILL